MTATQPPLGPATGWGLSGKVAVVTGASSGIGAGVTEYLAREGMGIVAVGRDEARLSRQERVLHDLGARCETVAADIATAAGPATVIDRAVAAFDRIDLLVNVAGICNLKSFRDGGPDELDQHYRINVWAPYALTHAALPHFEDGAAIVFVSSNLAAVAMADATPYSATKGAIDSITRGLALELAPRIRVNAVAPGIVRTPMTYRLDDEERRAEAIALTPAGRLGEPADIAAAVAYLASDASSYMVGSTVLVDGGWNVS